MSRLKITRRASRSAGRSLLAPAAATALALAVSLLLLALQGRSPLAGLRFLVEGGFGSVWALEDSLAKAVPIYLCSLGVAVAFRLQVWNIGAEGQFALGAVGATSVVMAAPELTGPAMPAAMALAAALAGGLWGLLPALLKLHMRANEIIVTLMLNYIAILFLDYLVYGPWKDPVSFGFPMTPAFPESAQIGRIGDTGVNWGVALCAVCGLAAWIFFRFTRLGYELKASGENVRAARYARLPYGRLVALVMVLSGALAGWAGFVEASATVGRLQPSIMVGYGYTAIVVAWLARLNPLSIGIAAFLLAGLRVGTENLQLELGVPAAFGQIIEGMILLTVLDRKSVV
jgi:general nucleoside transport system permease protein